MCIVNRRGESGAILESTISNACYAFWDGDGGEGSAIIESRISNARYAVWDGDLGEGVATTESRISNACYAVGSAVVGNGSGDITIFITEVPRCISRDLHCRIGDDCVLKVTDFKCPEGGGEEYHKKGE